MPLFSPDQIAKYAATMPPTEEVARNTAPGPMYRLGQGLVLGGTGLDIGSTQAVLNQGGHETNAAFGSRPNIAALAGIKGGLAGLELYGMKKMREAGHPTAAGVIGGLAGMVPLLAGIHNIRQLR